MTFTRPTNHHPKGLLMRQHQPDTLSETEVCILRALAAAAAGESVNPSIYRTPAQLVAVTGRSAGTVTAAVRELAYKRAYVASRAGGALWCDGLAVTELGEAALQRHDAARVTPATYGGRQAA